MTAPRPALFLDRDGVLNEDRGYVGRWADFAWMPGAIALIGRFNRRGWPVVVVTNQSGVARGLYGEGDVNALHEAMNADLADHGARIDAFYFCPFHEDAIEPRYRVADHPDRKPNPGMILRAADDLGLDLPASILVGDNQRDIVAAERAGVRGLLYRTGNIDAFVADALSLGLAAAGRDVRG